MTIAEPPLVAILRGQRSTGDGLHLVSRSYRKGTRLDPHMHREAQLVYAARGTMQVTTPKGRWLVPPDRAVWVPARLVHAIDVLADIEMRTLYFDVPWLRRERRSPNLKSEFVVRVSPLLQQTILALFDKDNPVERIALLIKLVMLELHTAGDSATFIPLPQEVRCRRAADIVLAAPGQLHEIATLAQKVGTSARTLSRLFAAETQLSFKSWCQRARIAAAIQRLSVDARASVKQVAAEFGYASVPAFSHAFRQVTGKTPTQFVEAK
jgi:AraC-like DNA-binding protein